MRVNLDEATLQRADEWNAPRVKPARAVMGGRVHAGLEPLEPQVLDHLDVPLSKPNGRGRPRKS